MTRREEPIEMSFVAPVLIAACLAVALVHAAAEMRIKLARCEAAPIILGGPRVR